jgi:hypothetical protein
LPLSARPWALGRRSGGFRYLAGTSGGSAFVLVFIVVCIVIATPLLVAGVPDRTSRTSQSARGGLASSRWRPV